MTAAWDDALRAVGNDGAWVTVSMTILWLAVAYLILLGFMVIARPALARRFLSAFAQTTVANLIEVGLRLLVGMAFVAASNRTKDPPISVAVGLFLAISALLMLLLPAAHRRFAAKSTARLSDFFALFGLASLALAAVLAWFIA